MLQVDQFIRGDGGGGRGGDAHLRAQGGVQKADGLVGAVAADNSLFLGCPGAALEFVGDEGRHVESGILQQFLADADGGGQLVGAQGNLAKGHVALGNLRFFFDPGSAAVVGDQRNLPVAGRGGDHMHQAAHDVLFLEGLHQLVLKLVGDGIAAFGKLAHLQGVPDFVGSVAAELVPERFPVSIAGGATLGIEAVGTVGAASQHGAGGIGVHFPIHLLGAFQAVNGPAQVDYLLFHAFIGLGVFGVHDAVFVLVGVEEGFRLVPYFAALLPQFKNFAHTFSPLFFASRGMIKASLF